MRSLTPATCLVLVLTACSGDDPDALPPEMWSWGYEPLVDTFGYDPEGAAAAYGQDLEFVNLDPAAFDHRTDEGQAARRALGWLVTHPDIGAEFPMWARIGLDPDFGPVDQRMAELGLLPSPYLAQRESPVPIALQGGGSQTVTVPLSLAETSYTFDEGGDVGKRSYLGVNCMFCHGGVYGDKVVAGAPNNRYHAQKLFNETLGPNLRLFARSEGPEAVSGVADRLLKTGASELGADIRGTVDVSQPEFDVTMATKYAYDQILHFMDDESNKAVGMTTVNFGGPTLQACGLTPNGEDFDDWDVGEDGAPGELVQRLMDDWEELDIDPVVGARPWWLARYSGTHFYIHFTPHGPVQSAADLALATTSPVNHGNHHTPAFDERYKRSYDLQVYMDQIQSPPFPRDLDWDAATRGLEVYNNDAACAACHGTLVPDESGVLDENSMLTLNYNPAAGEVRIAEVGTDDTLWRAHAATDYCMENVQSNAQFGPSGATYRKAPLERMDDGYYNAPPLIGVWASAPYLHNGSMPTVTDVLLPPEDRPTYWRLDPDPYAYDYDRLGVAHEVLTEAPKTEREDGWDWHIYDTTLERHGMTNVGHDYGKDLTDQQRSDVVELLKALGTHNVRPNPEPVHF